MITQRPLPYLSNSEPYFERIRTLGQAVFLDSGRPKCPWGRFDILTAAPVESLELKAGQGESAFEQLESLYQRYSTDRLEDPDLPFQGGIIGHFSYDLGRDIERLPEQADNFAELPDMRVGMYLWAVIVDHHKKLATLVADPRVSSIELDSIETRLLEESLREDSEFVLTAPFTANMEKDAYKDKLGRVDNYIHSGDCYQVNFAQRWKTQYQGDSWQAYKKLRLAAPTPYSAFLDSASDQILSLSPEQFLETKNLKVTTKPIKGTRPRSSDASEDNRLKEELANSIKDRAENLMIVDLLRNDLSKVCEHNSVKVPKLFNIESYANVHHKVSTVTGVLRQNFSPIGLLKHCFPGGSITGAPKIRAMEIIEELEPHRRSIYCGSIGYISLCGRMDTSITIRTLLCEDQNIYCWAGGGIVADSEPSQEYKETFDKVNNLLQCLEETIS